MKAVLLAAGLGTRLGELTREVPKILAPVQGRPLLAWQLEYLARSGVDEVAINLHHHADQVSDYLEQRPQPLAFRTSFEPELLGTGGALRPLSGFLDRPFVLLYGDVLTDVDLDFLRRVHRLGGALGTLTYYRATSALDKGVLELDEAGRVTGFVEKPDGERPSSLVNAGVCVFEPGLLSFVPRGFSDLGRDVIPAVLAAREPLYGVEIGGYLRDVGTPDSLVAAGRDLGSGVIAW